MHSFCVKNITTLLLYLFWFIGIFLGAQSYDIEIISRYYKVRIDNNIYQVINLDCGDKRGKGLIDINGKLICDRKILEKAFYIGMLSEFNLEPENRSNRFGLFRQRILQYKDIFNQAVSMIPWMEIFAAWAFDLGPRAVTEASIYALSGGTSLLKMSKVISMDLLRNSLEYLGKNPRAFLVAIHYKMLQDSALKMEHLEKMLSAYMNQDVLDYDKIKNMDDLYWTSACNGWMAIKIYQSISGDLIDNVRHAFDAIQDEILSYASIKTGEPVKYNIFAKQMEKTISVTMLGVIAASERQNWEKARNEYTRLNEEYLKDAVAACKYLKENNPKEDARVKLIANIDDYQDKLTAIKKSRIENKKIALKEVKAESKEGKDEIYKSQFQGKEHPEEKEIIIIDKSDKSTKKDYLERIGDAFYGLANGLASIEEYNKFLADVAQRNEQVMKEFQNRSMVINWQQSRVPQNSADINHSPFISAYFMPANGTSYILTGDMYGLQIRFEWEGGDHDPGDQVTYWLYIKQNASDLSNDIPIGNAFWTGFTKNTLIRWYSTGTWYWKIIAFDKKNLIAAGPIWSFNVQ